ncbi:hypothetical protein GCM10023107_01400 [Actinoplanes octamycinicus]
MPTEHFEHSFILHEGSKVLGRMYSIDGQQRRLLIENVYLYQQPIQIKLKWLSELPMKHRNFGFNPFIYQ